MQSQVATTFQNQASSSCLLNVRRLPGDQYGLITYGLQKFEIFFSNEHLYVPAISLLIDAFYDCLPEKQQQAKQLTNDEKKTFIQTVVQKLSIKIRTATRNQKHFMESEPSSTGDVTQEHEQLIFVNNQWLTACETSPTDRTDHHYFLSFVKLIHEIGHMFTPFIMNLLGFEKRTKKRVSKEKIVKLQQKKPAKEIFITPQRIGTYEKQKKKKGDAGHQLEQIIFGGRVASMVSSKDKRASFTIDALVVSDDVKLGCYPNKTNGLYLINHQCPSRYTNEFIKQCTNLDDFKIFKSDHYGLATVTNLNAMNNTINLNEQVENNEAPNNIRPSENYFNCYDDGDDSENSTISSNSLDKDDVDLSIWNDKDSDIEYTSSDDEDEKKDNILINKETE